METHAALEAGEEDPHADIIPSTPSKKAAAVVQEEQASPHRPRAPRKPNGQVSIPNLFQIYSKSIPNLFHLIS